MSVTLFVNAESDIQHVDKYYFFHMINYKGLVENVSNINKYQVNNPYKEYNLFEGWECLENICNGVHYN